VLVVEDDAEVRRYVEVVLKRFGYRILVAESPAAARRLASGSATIDLLLSDVVMPGRTGPELAEELSRDRTDMRTLFMSGYARRGGSPRLAVPASKLLPKPFTASALLDAVRDVMAGRPVKQTQAAEPRKECGVTTGSPERTVLIVEDDPPLRELIAVMLARLGWTTLGARSAEEALALAAREPASIALVIADVVLPGMDGFAMEERLVRICGDAPVLYISGHAEDSTTVRRGLESSGRPFLLKPFTHLELGAAIDGALG